MFSSNEQYKNCVAFPLNTKCSTYIQRLLNRSEYVCHTFSIILHLTYLSNTLAITYWYYCWFRHINVCLLLSCLWNMKCFFMREDKNVSLQCLWALLRLDRESRVGKFRGIAFWNILFRTNLCIYWKITYENHKWLYGNL